MVRTVVVTANARNPALPKLIAEVDQHGLTRYMRLDGARGQVDNVRTRKPVYKLLTEVKFCCNVTDKEIKDYYHNQLKGKNLDERCIRNDPSDT